MNEVTIRRDPMSQRCAFRSVVSGAALLGGVFALAGSVHAAALTQNYWIGPNGNGTGDGNWDVAANWRVNASIPNPTPPPANISVQQHWVPGSNADGSKDTNGVTGGFQDDEYINNGGSNPYTVTINSDVSANTSYRYLQINAQYNFGSAPQPSAPVTINVDSGGYLVSGQTQVSGGGIDATVNVNGGTVWLTSGISVGAVLQYAKAGGATGTLNVSSGTLYSGRVSAGYQSNGIVNLSGTGVINTATNPNNVPTYGGITLGSGSTTKTINGNPVYFAGTGTFNQSGGTLLTTRESYIGNGSVGEYNLSAGTVSQGDTGRGFYVGYASQGTFDVSGGTATLGQLNVGGNNNGNAAGLMKISGGNVTATKLIVGNSGGGGTGELRVIGDGGGLAVSGTTTTYSNATLDFQIGSSGISAITDSRTSGLTDGRSLNNLSGTLKLDLLGNFTPTNGQSFVLMTTNVIYQAKDGNNNVLGAGIITDAVTYNNGFGSVTNAGLFLDPSNVGTWTYGVDPTYDQNNAINGYKLVATYVPEPASVFSLMGIGGLALLRRRRGV